MSLRLALASWWSSPCFSIAAKCVCVCVCVFFLSGCSWLFRVLTEELNVSYQNKEPTFLVNLLLSLTLSLSVRSLYTTLVSVGFSFYPSRKPFVSLIPPRSHLK